MAGNELTIGISEKEVNSKGFATYYLYMNGNVPSWISLNDPNIIRDANFNGGSRICPGGTCSIPANWKDRQILLIDSKTKRIFIKPNYSTDAVEITGDAQKYGLQPLSNVPGKPAGTNEGEGSGGEGKGGAAPFGFKLPFFDVDLWSNLPSWLLWVGAANGVYNLDKKVRLKQPIGIVGTAGVVLGVYCGYELVNRKSKK